MSPLDALKTLAQMTEGLRPVSESRFGSVDDLRFLIARSLRDQGATTDEKNVDAAYDDGADEGLETFIRFFEDSLPDSLAEFRRNEGRLSVTARPPLASLPINIGGIDPGIRNIASGPALGPFRGPGGFGTIFDVFLPATRLVVVTEGDSRPVMLFTAASRRTTQRNPDIRIQAGTVWVRADSIDPGADSGSYVGFTVSGGQVDIDSAISFANGTITAKAPFKGSLSLQLAAPALEKDRCPDVTAKMPETLTLAWNGGLSVALGPGTAELAGQNFDFSPTGTVAFEPGLGQLVFAAKSAPEKFDAGPLASPVAALSGKTQIGKAGWAIPLTTIADPAKLPQAAGDSAWVMWGQDPLSLLWTGAPKPAAKMQEPVIIIRSDGYAIFATRTTHLAGDAKQSFSLWQLAESAKPQHLQMTFPDPFMSIVGCGPALGEYVAFTNRCHPVLNRPLDAVGRTIDVPEGSAVTLINEKDDERRILTVAVEATDRRGFITMALENVYLAVHSPTFMGFWGQLKEANIVTDGELWLSYEVANWIPTLPDPYVANFSLPDKSFRKGRPGGRILARIGWDTALPDIEFDGLLGFPALGDKQPTSAKPAYGYENELWYPDGSQTENGRKTLNKDQQAAWEKAEGEAARTIKKLSVEADGRNIKLNHAIDNAVRKTMGPFYGALLLDVSTNRHQIGVAIAPRINRNTGATAGITHNSGITGTTGASAAMVIRDMSLRTQIDNLRVFTLPLVQWEPVRTLGKDQNIDLGIFPTPLASPNDGGATVIGQNSARLAPAIPDLALDEMVDEFADGQHMAMVTTLPFGLRAGMVLEPGDQGVRKADTVGYTTPTFDGTGTQLAGGLQLTVMAEGGRRKPGEESPSFRGAAAQLLNGVRLDTGDTLGISVLGSTGNPMSSVEAMFNNEFAGTNQRVPLTRYDVSGYGGSTFSDWQNPYGAFAEATKVQFQLMVGRTALEIVKFASMIYPFAIKVTRSVTIERKGGGGVIRADTGWLPTTPGIFDFRYNTRLSEADPWELQPSPYTVHPGLIKGLFDIERIRPVSSEVIDLPGGGRVAPMYFDADVAIDGLPNSGRTRCRKMLGYLHVLPVGEPLSISDLSALMKREGAVGGPIDAAIDVAQSRFKMRALRAEIDLADDAGTPVLVGAIRGTLVFGPSGSWSVVRQPGPATPVAPPEVELMDEGVPVIRQGRIKEPSGENLVFDTTRGDYRFAEAEDLFRQMAPAWDIGFLQTAPTHAFLYRRPFIRPDGPGDKRIESTLAPCFADLFMRSSTQSLFPAVENTIQLTDHDYTLDINTETGFFRLNPSVNLPNPRPELMLAEGTDRLRMFYDSTTLSFAIGEELWSLDLPGVEMWNDMAGFEKVSGMRMHIVGGTSLRPQMRQIESLLHSTVEDIMRFIPGITDRGIQGPVDLSSTNLKIKVKLATYSEQIVKIPVPINLAAKFWVASDVGSEIDTSTGETSLFAGTKVGMDLRGRTKTTPWSLIFGCAFELGGAQYLSGPLVGESKLSFEARLYVGAAYGGKVGPFKAIVALGLGPVIQYSDGTWKYGGFLFFESKVDLAVVKVKIFAEFAMVGYSKTDAITSERKSYIDFQGELGINVSFGWIISIKISVEVVETKEVS